MEALLHHSWWRWVVSFKPRQHTNIVFTFYNCIRKVLGLNHGRSTGNKVRRHCVTSFVSSDKPWDNTGTYNNVKPLSLQTSPGTSVPTTMQNFYLFRQVLGEHRYLQQCKTFVSSDKICNNNGTYNDAKLLSLQTSPENTPVHTTMQNFCLLRQALRQHRYIQQCKTFVSSDKPWDYTGTYNNAKLLSLQTSPGTSVPTTMQNFCLFRQALRLHWYIQQCKTFVSSDKPWDNTGTYNNAKLLSPQTSPGTTPVPTTMQNFCLFRQDLQQQRYLQRCQTSIYLSSIISYLLLRNLVINQRLLHYHE
jgi:hypothetical protein